MYEFDEAQSRAAELSSTALTEIKEWCQLSGEARNLSKSEQDVFLQMVKAIDAIECLSKR